MTEQDERLQRIARQLVNDGIEPTYQAALRAAAVVIAATELIARREAATAPSDQDPHRAH